MHNTKTWREVLGAIISEPHEKQRIARALNVSPFTLVHWVQGKATPQTQQMYQLLRALPQQQDALLPSIAEEFEEISQRELASEPETDEIPSIFYAHVLKGSTTTPLTIHYWSQANIILQQAIVQLDPYRTGMAIRITRCMPPAYDGKIRSLCESVGVGTPPWSGTLEQSALLLGAESLAGYALTSGHSIVIDSPDDYSLFPIPQREYEASTAAFPIMRANLIAGVLLVASSHSGFFTSASLSLIQSYTNLLALAFETGAFYDPQIFALQTMPPIATQQNYLTTFHQRVADVLARSMQGGQPLNTTQAELQVWQQIEEEFLALASPRSSTTQ